MARSRAYAVPFLDRKWLLDYWIIFLMKQHIVLVAPDGIYLRVTKDIK